jgi:hypothetical protein
MWRRLLVTLCVLPTVALASCAGDADESSAPSSRTSTSTATTTTTPQHDPASDEKTLTLLLGPGMPPRCSPDTPRTDTRCGDLLSAAANLVGIVKAALEGMPKSPGYVKIAEAVSSFEKAYGTLKSLGCYTPQPAGGVDDAFCRQFADLVTLSWLNLSATIDQLDPAS